MPSPEPSVLGHIIEGRVEYDPVTDRLQIMSVGSEGRAKVVDLMDLVASYVGKEVRFTLASFENLEILTHLAEQVGGSAVSGVMPDELPGVSFNIQRSRS